MAEMELPLNNSESGGRRCIPQEAARRTELWKVFKEEQDEIQKMIAARTNDGNPQDPEKAFALAFSGGGMRAAAFQCGVLWRLAEMNMLKHATYLTAVSGGGYISMAFASRCYQEYEEKKGPERGKVDDWYRKVVAKTVVRMQTNAGNFVRQCCRPDSDNTSTSNCFLRLMDVPVLIFVLVVTILVHPTFFYFVVMMPLVQVTENQFGDQMRNASLNGDLGPFWNGTAQESLRPWIEGTICLTFFLHVFGRLPWLRYPGSRAEKGERVDVSWQYLLYHGIRTCVIRMSIVLFAYYIALICAMGFQLGFYDLKAGDDPTPDSVRILLMFVSNPFSAACTLFAFSCIIIPYTGSSLALSLLNWVLPSAIFLSFIPLVQFRVFGKLNGTKQTYLGMAYTEETWGYFQYYSHIVMVIFSISYPGLRSILHTYYVWLLVRNFFAQKKDIYFKKLLDCPYCPFNILTATSSDYKPPVGGHADGIIELSLSALHMGSPFTEYVEMPDYRTIGRCTALTAAGGVDAMALTLSGLLSSRVISHVVNLSWGDYMLFDDKYPWFIRLPLSIFPCWRQPHWEPWEHKPCWGFSPERLERTKKSIPCWLYLYCILAAYVLGGSHPFFLWVAATMVVLLFIASCFSFECIQRAVCYSTLVRSIVQGMRVGYRGNRPPPMLYVTDGGCRDCTTLMQLVMRRQKRILMVMAAADPCDDLEVLKKAMDMVKDANLARFYDPNDPRRDVKDLFSDFKNDKNKTYLHIGITYMAEGQTYCCRSSGDPKPSIWAIGNGKRAREREYGQLFIVKNRLPKNYNTAVKPHLTEDEIQARQAYTFKPGKMGIDYDGEGKVQDVEKGAPADVIGIKPGAKIVRFALDGAVGQAFSKDALADAEAGTSGYTVTFLVRQRKDEGHQQTWGENARADDLGAWCCCDCSHYNKICNCGPKWPHGSFSNFMYLSPMWVSSLTRLAHEMSADAIEAMQNYKSEPWEAHLDER